MSESVIIEDCRDEDWLIQQVNRTKECIVDRRIVDADEVDTWRIRLSRLEDQLKRVRGVSWRDW